MLVALMVLSAGACGKKSDNPAASGQDTQSTASGQPTAGKVSLPIVSQPVTLNILATADSRMTLDNNVMTFKELESRTNVHLEWELLPTTGADEKFNLIMMSGKLPDIVNYANMTNAYKYAMQGAFIPLEDQIKKYAPNLQKTLDNPPYPIKNLKAEMSAGDGHIYMLPIFSDNYVGELYFIREDWLKNVGLNIPTTTDELYTVLKAFKEKDPNKNSQADDIPYSGEHNLADVRCLMSSFGAYKSFYVAKDNTIKFSPVADKDRQLEAINYLRKLYSEGLIDQEIMSQKREQYNSKAAGDKVGMAYCWSISGADTPNKTLKQSGAEKHFVGMLPVKGPHGDQFKEDPQAYMTPRVLISKDNKNIETTMKWLDYMFTEEGRLLLTYGIEGKTYNMANGVPKRITFDDASQSPQKVYGLVFPGVTYYSEQKDSYSKEVNDAYDLYAKSNVICDPFPNLPLTDDEQSTKAKVTTDLETYITENLGKLITGVDPISKYDSYVEGFSKLGVDNLLKVYNDAYKKYLDFNKK